MTKCYLNGCYYLHLYNSDIVQRGYSSGGGGGGGRLLFLPGPFGHDDGPGPVLSDGQVRAAGETVSVLRHGAKDAQADATHEADADDVPVTEARGAEVDVDAGGEDQVPRSCRWAGEE